jgi:hypothetical protein
VRRRSRVQRPITCGCLWALRLRKAASYPAQLLQAHRTGGAAPALKVFGKDLPTPDETCIRDFVHVSDLGRAHVKALGYLASGGESITLNLGAGRGIEPGGWQGNFDRLLTGCG